jgi:hypothetical protein
MDVEGGKELAGLKGPELDGVIVGSTSLREKNIIS